MSDHTCPKALLREIAEDLPGASEAEVFAQWRHEIYASERATELMEVVAREVFELMWSDVRGSA